MNSGINGANVSISFAVFIKNKTKQKFINQINKIQKVRKGSTVSMPRPPPVALQNCVGLASGDRCVAMTSSRSHNVETTLRSFARLSFVVIGSFHGRWPSSVVLGRSGLGMGTPKECFHNVLVRYHTLEA